MDVKDLRTEPALRERNNDGSKYTQGGVAMHQSNRNKLYQDIGSNTLAKTEGVPVRPCAVIGPDRVVPPPAANDAFLKKGPADPWPSSDNGYRRPPDYSQTVRLHQSPVRNISPRQTFQENMQRINVPPTYNVARHSDSANFNNLQDRSVTVSKNVKPNMAPEAKYCDVPYAIANQPKNAREPEMYVSSVNSQLNRSAPHVWPPGSVNVNAPMTYSVNEPYQYPQYTNCAGQRPPVVPIPRPHRTIQEDPAFVYSDHYYRDAIGRLKPYPPIKERCPQSRYEYVGNYGGQFHPPPPIQPLKYDIPKSGQSHPYPVHPHYKYLDNRVPDPSLEGYQRSTSHQPHYNLPFRSQLIHPSYPQVSGNTPQKVQPYPTDGSVKGIPSNRLHYDATSKMYIDYENSRTKPYPMTDNYYISEMNRIHSLKNQMVMPNYSQIGMRPMPSQQYYLKDNTQMKPFDYIPTFRNFEPHLPGNPVLRHAPQFSPNTLAISPTDSSASNDTSQTHGTLQEDCGYVSQSSTTSVRSIDSGIQRLPHEYYKRHDFRYGPIVGSPHALAKTDFNSKDNKQKQIDVRQFLQMWNEGEEENNSEINNSKEIIIQTGSSDTSNFPKHVNTEDQLYVLGLVNVPSEELSKYEHIEKISKLPENIKGYNNLELFSRFEEAMESCNTTTFKTIPKEYQNSSKENLTKIVAEALPRPVSPLDVEAKISQSVIHKEVGCNFEIKPCSPKMLNVEIAAPAQNILGERIIEKVSNPVSKIVKSPLPMKSDENPNSHMVIRQDNVFAVTDNPSCKMVRSPYPINNMDSVKTNYTLHDLEINSGMCLASLPQLDNEIELNFPEVNQQFINANKKEESSIINCHQSKLQEDSSLSDNKDVQSKSDKNKIMKTELDKNLSKLSKYRKSKPIVIDNSENINNAVRTNSVIIKNPENIENKMLENNLNVPMNLSSQSSQWYDSPSQPSENKGDMALDFSLHKSDIDLPIIETEKETIVQFETNHSQSSYENVLSTDAHAFCQESKCVSDITVDSKIAVENIKTASNDTSCIQSITSKNISLPTDSTPHEKSGDMTNTKKDFVDCIQNDSNISFKAQRNKEMNDKHDINSLEIIKSPATQIITETTISNKTNVDNDFQDNNYDIAEHAVDTKVNVSNFNESCKYMISHDLHESVKKCCSDENTVRQKSMIDNDKDGWENSFKNDENITMTSSNTVCNNKEVENVNQIFSTKLNKSELVVTCQNENDFEHDEISASLEKLFRETNEEISQPKIVDCFSSASLKSMEKITSHQSKELYSPWIQKLLTHSEGSCSHSKQPQKQRVKSIFDPEEPLDQPFKLHKDKSKDVLEQEEKIAYDEKIAPRLYCKPTKSVTNETNDSNKTPDNVTNSMEKIYVNCDKNDNQSDITTKAEKHDACKKKLSPQIINDKKRKTECVADTSKRKIKKRKLLVEKQANFINCDSNYLNNETHVNNYTNNIPKTEPDMTTSRKAMSDLENTISKADVNNSTNNISKTKYLNKTNNETDVSSYTNNIPKTESDMTTSRKAISDFENTISKADDNNYTNNISKTEIDMATSRRAMCDFENAVHDSADSSSKNLLNIVSDSTKNPNKEKSCDTVVVSETFNRDSDFKLNVVVGDISNESIVKNVKCDTLHCPSINEHQIGDLNQKSSNENIIESISTDTNKNIDESSINYVICTNDSADLMKSSNHSSKSLPESDSGISTKHLDKISVDESMIADNKTDIVEDREEMSEKNNIVFNGDQNVSGKLCDEIFDNGTDCGIEKPNQELLDHVPLQCQHANKPSESLNISQKVFEGINKSNSLHSSSAPLSECVSYVGIDNKSIDNMVKERDSYEDTKDTLDAPQHLGTICDYDLSQVKHDHCTSENGAPNDCIEHQFKENENKDTLVENVTEAQNNDCQMPEDFDGLQVVCTDNKMNLENLEIPSVCKGDFTENLNGKLTVGNTLEDFEMNDITNSDSIIFKKDDIFPEDPSNPMSEILCCNDLGYSNGSKLQETKIGEIIAENITQNITKDTNDFTCKNDTADMQVNTDQKSRHYIDDLSKNKHGSDSTNCQEPNEIDYFDGKDTEVQSSTKLFPGLLSKPNFEGCSTVDVSDIDTEHETKDESDKENSTGNEVVIQHSDDVHISKSSDNYESKEVNTEIKSLLQENKSDNPLTNLSDCVSENWIEDYKEQTTLVYADNVQEIDDENVCYDQDSLCDSVAENNLVELENHISNIHNPESLIEYPPVKQNLTLKRSFSDSALNRLKNRETPDRHLIDNTPMWPPKRQKVYEVDDSAQQTTDENFCNFIQNRRNSISSYYNAENVSFCILIDNDCILEDENEEKICFAEVTEDCITEVNTTVVEDNVGEVMGSSEEDQVNFSDSVVLGYDGEKSIQEVWLDDVACVETVVSDDIAEELDKDVPRDNEVSNYDDSEFFNGDMSEHIHEANFDNEKAVCDNVSEFESTYRSLHGDDKIMLYDEDSQYADGYNALYSGQCLEKILSKSYHSRCSPSPTSDYMESILSPQNTSDQKLPENKENICVKNVTYHFESKSDHIENEKNQKENYNSTMKITAEICKNFDQNETSCSTEHINTLHLPESSIDNVFSYKKDDPKGDSNNTTSSSPEVSSTTFDEKSSSILLKITNYNGSRISEINEVNHNKPRCKFTESKDYSNAQGGFPKRPLITKAAQKYIPPLKESIRDLKVKLPLPQQRLLKLKQLKHLKSEPKAAKQNTSMIPKKQKPKPNFEDVLKNIDEVQIKMHKLSSKKNKNSIPKVVIKKNVNGSHYTSSSSKERFNPDLTGRKWQPWVFLERNRFIDNMAIRKKTRAVYSHRKNAYVFLEKFKKYKSVSSSSAKFVITQPKLGESSKGLLKYTIRLKHSK